MPRVVNRCGVASSFAAPISFKEMQLRVVPGMAPHRSLRVSSKLARMKTFEGLYDLVIDSIIEDDVRELQAPIGRVGSV